MNIKNAYSRVRLPRITSYLIHTAKGGGFEMMERNSKRVQFVDTVPKHAKAIPNQVFPIRKEHAKMIPVVQATASLAKEITKGEKN